MQEIKFPIPSRKNYVPSPYEPDEDGVLDIGYNKGVISGGRPYRLECWQMEELLMATVFFSDEGLEYYNRADLILLLELEEIIHFTGSRQLFQYHHIFDDAGIQMLAINITLANAKGEYAKIIGALRRYK